MINKKTRDLLQQAFGSPPESDPAFALQILLDVLEADAKVLGDNDSSTLALALRCRIEALKAFVDGYMVVTWAETDADRATATQPKTGLHVVPGGAT